MLTGIALGQAIEEARKLKRVSKADLARHFNVKAPSIQSWVKHGRISKKHLDELFRYFADVVGPDHWGVDGAKAEAGVKEPQATYSDARGDIAHFAQTPFEREVLAAARQVPKAMRQRFIGWLEERLREMHPEATAGPTKKVDGGRDATHRKGTT